MTMPHSTPAGDADRPASLKRIPRPAADEGVDPIDTATDQTASPQPASPRAGKKRGPYNVQHLDKRPASYRLPPDVIGLIDEARQAATDRGEKLTKDDAVAMAIRSFWGKKRQRR